MPLESNRYLPSNNSLKEFILPQNSKSKFAMGSEQLLRVYIANSLVILYGIDKDGIFTLSEGKGLEALGLQAGEVVGKSVFEVFGEYPDILANIRHALNGEQRSWRGEVKNYIMKTK
jgi:PAS domain S-box-containing protein